MIFHPVEMTDKSGNTILLRNAEETDAEELIRYLKTTSAETRFLVR